ncbi:dienelactone hydrolase family protein [Saccharomonospora sp.]|uniref:dienelactone hydrolase family protein n=1 Tax=Saccharomonospora sp. TaxID=33913 RepID=UPI0026102FDF|nr:dienelactone hydrolase family protein [Saccharomonospora sp.]
MTVPFGVATGSTALSGDLTVPADTLGVVAFAHGSGSSRNSPRNVAVARSLQDQRLATLLFDLLTADEGRYDAVTGRLRFDIDLLSDRLVTAVDQLREDVTTRDLAIGLFGASTGAAAAFVAAARRPEAVRAVVSRGGRPDLAGAALAGVECPTLLVVGGEDTQVLCLNEQAAQRMLGPVELAVVPNATHLFEEPGALERVADLAATWFTRHLT